MLRCYGCYADTFYTKFAAVTEKNRVREQVITLAVLLDEGTTAANGYHIGRQPD